MKLLFAILLCTIPVLWDLAAGRYFWKKKRTVPHWVTSLVRLLIMAVLAYYNPAVEPWRSVLISVGFHYFFFPALYNRLVIDQKWDYLGKTALLDRFEAWVRSKLTKEFVIWFKIAFLMTAIKFYINPCVHWDCFPF